MKQRESLKIPTDEMSELRMDGKRERTECIEAIEQCRGKMSEIKSNMSMLNPGSMELQSKIETILTDARTIVFGTALGTKKEKKMEEEMLEALRGQAKSWHSELISSTLMMEGKETESKQQDVKRLEKNERSIESAM